MEEKSLLNKITSKYIIELIALFMKGKNYFYKLISHCKSIQTKMDLSLFNYQYIYFSKRAWNPFIMEPLLKNEELRLNFQKMEMMKTMKENDKWAFDINHEFNSKNYFDIKNPLIETITNTDVTENLDIKIDFDNIESKDSKEPLKHIAIYWKTLILNIFLYF